MQNLFFPLIVSLCRKKEGKNAGLFSILLVVVEMT